MAALAQHSAAYSKKERRQLQAQLAGGVGRYARRHASANGAAERGGCVRSIEEVRGPMPLLRRASREAEAPVRTPGQCDSVLQKQGVTRISTPPSQTSEELPLILKHSGGRIGPPLCKARRPKDGALARPRAGAQCEAAGDEATEGLRHEGDSETVARALRVAGRCARREHTQDRNDANAAR